MVLPWVPRQGACVPAPLAKIWCHKAVCVSPAGTSRAWGKAARLPASPRGPSAPTILGQERGDVSGRGSRAGRELLGLRVLQPALWALRFGFLLSALFLFLARPRGCQPQRESGLRGTAAGTGRGKHGAGAGQAVGDGGELMP